MPEQPGYPQGQGTSKVASALKELACSHGFIYVKVIFIALIKCRLFLICCRNSSCAPCEQPPQRA